ARCFVAAGLMSRNLRRRDPQELHMKDPPFLPFGHGWQHLDTSVSRSLRSTLPVRSGLGIEPSPGPRTWAPYLGPAPQPGETRGGTVARAKKAVRASQAPMNPMAEQVGPDFYDVHAMTDALTAPAGEPVTPAELEEMRTRH